MALNVTTAVIGSGCNTATASPSLAQWDRGQILQVSGVELPETYKVEFSNDRTLSAIPEIGTAAGVEIPNELLYSSSPITAYIVLTDTESRNTEYWVTIYVTPRPFPEDMQPDPERQDVIDQLIAQLNDGVDRAETAADEADQSATEAERSARGAADYYHEASTKASQADSSAASARLFVGMAEDYAQAADDSATQAAQSATAAAGSETPPLLSEISSPVSIS